MMFSSNRSILVSLILLLSFIVVGCLSDNQSTSPAAEILPTNTFIPTPTNYSISVIIATDTPEGSINIDHPEQTPIPLIDFEDIAPGVYLLYEEWSAEANIYGINLESGEEVYFSNWWYVYNNQRNQIAYLNDERDLEILDIHSNESNEIPLDFRCSERTWSPDDSFIAINCEDRVYVISVDDLSVQLLTIWTHPSIHSYWNPTWSPDGKWIATTFRQLSSLNITEVDGIYLLDASCITNPATCEEKMTGPYFPLSHHVRFAWSPYGDSIAAYVDYSIKQVNLNTNDIKTLIDEISDVYDLVWSPDGKWIYYSQATDLNKVDIYKVSIQGGDPVLFAEDKGVVLSILEID
jgi:WD40 repeat protein